MGKLLDTCQQWFVWEVVAVCVPDRFGSTIALRRLNRDVATLPCNPASDNNQYLALTPHAKTASDEFGDSYPASPALQVRASNLLKVRATNVLFPRAENCYVGYFENPYGEQWIFTLDRVTGKATLRGGDVGWNTKFDVTNGSVADLILGKEEQLWLQACWSAAQKQVVRD